MKIKKGILYLILLSGVFGVLYATFHIYTYFNEYKVSAEKYEQLHDMYQMGKMNLNKKEKLTNNKRESTSEENELYEINEDYVGWISVEGTDVDYPVVLGDDNDYYLDHNFYQEYDKVGAIFMDYRNSRDTLGKNTIIYGHNMRDKSMFSSLVNVLNDDSKEGKKIRLDFQGDVYVWEIVTAYKTRNTDWMQVNFDTDEDYKAYLSNLGIVSSKFPTEGALQEDDKVITLATCTTHIRDERIVVQGKFIKKE